MATFDPKENANGDCPESIRRGRSPDFSFSSSKDDLTSDGTLR